MEEHSKKEYICNRCGRSDFMNGHALGGHKKYCGKPEYVKINACKKRKTSKEEKISKETKKFKNKKVGTTNNEYELQKYKLDEFVNFKDFDIDQSLEYLFIEEYSNDSFDDDSIFHDEYFPFDYDQYTINDNL